MKEQLITFETAKLAKEKGFDILVNNYYDHNEELKYHKYKPSITVLEYHAPTQSLLQKWLREKHDIRININTYYFEDLKKYGYEVEDIIYLEGWKVFTNPKETYEEALEFGLQEALKVVKI